jgi:hypothetical protein
MDDSNGKTRHPSAIEFFALTPPHLKPLVSPKSEVVLSLRIKPFSPIMATAVATTPTRVARKTPGKKQQLNKLANDIDDALNNIEFMAVQLINSGKGEVSYSGQKYTVKNLVEQFKALRMAIPKEMASVKKPVKAAAPADPSKPAPRQGFQQVNYFKPALLNFLSDPNAQLTPPNFQPFVLAADPVTGQPIRQPAPLGTPINQLLNFNRGEPVTINGQAYPRRGLSDIQTLRRIFILYLEQRGLLGVKVLNKKGVEVINKAFFRLDPLLQYHFGAEFKEIENNINAKHNEDPAKTPAWDANRIPTCQLVSALFKLREGEQPPKDILQNLYLIGGIESDGVILQAAIQSYGAHVAGAV